MISSLLLLLSLMTLDQTVTVRLLDPVSSVQSKAGDRIRAVMVSPPTGIPIEGTLTQIRRIDGKQKRAEIQVRFDQHGATLIDVDNARETVGGGVIQGMPLFRAVPSKAEDALILAAHAHPIMLALFAATELTRREADKPEIVYPAGTEWILHWTDDVPSGSIRTPAPLPTQSGLEDLARSLPSRTVAHNETLSDFTNVVFVGEQDKLEEAFLKAGWLPAQHMSLKAAAEGFLAVADHHSYKEAPVSALYLQGRLPDLVFQKQTDTLAKRHHIRIWRQEATFRGQPVWLAAATHDIGIDFSRKARKFSHRIDPHIDLERQKVIDDFIFAEALNAAGLIPRSSVPTSGQNATGGHIETDGAIAVLLLR